MCIRDSLRGRKGLSGHGKTGSDCLDPVSYTHLTFGVRATENLIDNSKQKKEFENIILPVLMFDPVPFDDPNEMGDLALLRSSIWASIIENNQKYSISDGNMVAVPQSDVDVACAKLFGPQVTLKHQAFEDYLSIDVYKRQVLNTGILHGGLNLYNNGFSAGILALIIVPVIETFKKRKEHL